MALTRINTRSDKFLRFYRKSEKSRSPTVRIVRMLAAAEVMVGWGWGSSGRPASPRPPLHLARWAGATLTHGAAHTMFAGCSRNWAAG